jgi:hypothetical protein
MSFNYRLFRAPEDVAPAALTTDNSIVAAMAKSAVLVEPGGTFSGQDIKLEPPTSGAPAAPANETSATPAAQAAPAAPQAQTPPTQQASPAQANQPPAPAAQTLSWQDILKEQPVTDVLKAIGLDDAAVKFLNGRKTIDPKIAGLISHYEAKGDVKPYFEALTMDYSKMSDQDVMRRHLQAKYSNLTPEEFEELYRDEVIDRYKLDPDMYDEKQRKLGTIRLKADAGEPRAAMLAKQQELLLSPPPEAQVPQELLDYQLKDKAGKEAQEAYTGMLTNSPQFKDIVQQKKIVIGEGEEAYNYALDNPEETLAPLINTQKWYELMFNPDDTPRIGTQTLIAAIARDPVKFLADYGKHHQAIGASRALAPINNASPAQGTPARDGNAPLEPVAEMAKNGRLVTGGAGWN